MFMRTLRARRVAGVFYGGSNAQEFQSRQDPAPRAGAATSLDRPKRLVGGLLGGQALSFPAPGSLLVQSLADFLLALASRHAVLCSKFLPRARFILARGCHGGPDRYSKRPEAIGDWGRRRHGFSEDVGALGVPRVAGDYPPRGPRRYLSAAPFPG